MQADDAAPREPLQLVLIDKILLGIAAAEEEQGRTKRRPRPASVVRSWRKPRKGATPVPGPTMITGVSGSAGGRNGVLGAWIRADTVAPASVVAR